MHIDCIYYLSLSLLASLFFSPFRNENLNKMLSSVMGRIEQSVDNSEQQHWMFLMDTINDGCLVSKCTSPVFIRTIKAISSFVMHYIFEWVKSIRLNKTTQVTQCTYIECIENWWKKGKKKSQIKWEIKL